MFEILYLIDVFNSIRLISKIFGFMLIAVISTGTIMILATIDSVDSDGEKILSILKRNKKKAIIIPLITLLAMIFTPSEKAMYGYMIDKYVTKNNYDIVKEEFRENVDYFFKKINEVKSKK